MMGEEKAQVGEAVRGCPRELSEATACQQPGEPHQQELKQKRACCKARGGVYTGCKWANTRYREKLDG